LIFVCGPHCSGKTSLLEILEREGLIDRRGPEIGKELYYRRRFSPDARPEAFELEVARRELARDLAYQRLPGILGVETWHPGNLAYAAVRNPALLDELESLARRSPFLPAARGIRLTVSRQAISARTRTFASRRRWAADFYSAVDACMDDCLERLGLRDRVAVLDADGPLEAVAGAAREWLAVARREANSKVASGRESNIVSFCGKERGAS